MNLKKRTRLSVASLFLLSSINIHAETNRITTIRDWTLYESSTNQQTTCFVEANDLVPDGSGNSSLTTLFRIVKVKNSPGSPAELMMVLTQNSKKNTGTVAKINDTIQMGFADIDGSKNSFWGLSKNLVSFLENLSKIDILKTRAIGGKDKVKGSIPVQGYKDIIKEMENRCNGGAPIASIEFDQAFTSQMPDGIDPTLLDSAKTIALRGTYHSAYKTLDEINQTKKELAELLAKYQSLIDRLEATQALAKQIQYIKLPQANTDLNTALENQELARTELARIETLIPALKAKINNSQKILDDARAIIAPLIPEHDRLTSNLSSARNILSESQNRLNYIESRLSNGAQQLKALYSEANSIESRLPQKRNDLDRALSNYRQAQNQRAGFNPSWEKDSRLRNNFEYNRLHDDRRRTENELRQTEVDLERNRHERDRIERDLQNCRRQPLVSQSESSPNSNSVISLLEMDSLTPGQPQPRPEPFPKPQPQPPRPQPQPQPPPRPNCDHLERALEIANSQVRQNESERRNHIRRINEINSRIEQIEQQIDWEVRNEYDRLVRQEDQARREYEMLDNTIRNDEARLSQIRNVDIPRLENEQRALLSEKPSVINRINQAQSDVNRLSQELSNFEAANDWARKLSAVNAALRQLQIDEAELNVVLEQKQNEQQKLDKNIALAQAAQERIISLNAQLASLNKQASELNEALKNLPAERAPLDDKIAALQLNFENLKAKFLDLLK